VSAENMGDDNIRDYSRSRIGSRLFFALFLTLSILSIAYLLTAFGIFNFDHVGAHLKGFTKNKVIELSDIASISLHRRGVGEKTKSKISLSPIDGEHWIVTLRRFSDRGPLGQDGENLNNADNIHIFALHGGADRVIRRFIEALQDKTMAFLPQQGESYGFVSNQEDQEMIEIRRHVGSTVTFQVGSLVRGKAYLRENSAGQIRSVPARLIRDLRNPSSKLIKQYLVEGSRRSRAVVDLACEDLPGRVSRKKYMLSNASLGDLVDKERKELRHIRSIVDLLLSRQTWAFVGDELRKSLLHNDAVQRSTSASGMIGRCERYIMTFTNRLGRSQHFRYQIIPELVAKKLAVRAIVRHNAFQDGSDDPIMIVPNHVAEVVNRLLVLLTPDEPMVE